MVAGGSWDVGPNVLAIVVLLAGVINGYLTHRNTRVAKDTNATIVKELTSNDGTTLRDATDRIESSLGTTPPLPVGKQVYVAEDQPNGAEPT